MRACVCVRAVHVCVHVCACVCLSISLHTVWLTWCSALWVRLPGTNVTSAAMSAMGTIVTCLHAQVDDPANEVRGRHARVGLVVRLLERSPKAGGICSPRVSRNRTTMPYLHHTHTRRANVR